MRALRPIHGGLSLGIPPYRRSKPPRARPPGIICQLRGFVWWNQRPRGVVTPLDRRARPLAGRGKIASFCRPERVWGAISIFECLPVGTGHSRGCPPGEGIQRIVDQMEE